MNGKLNTLMVINKIFEGAGEPLDVRFFIDWKQTFYQVINDSENNQAKR